MLTSGGLSTALFRSGVPSSKTAIAETTPWTNSTSPPPGPEVLYEPPASAPQLETVEGWEADSLLVSDATAYIDGEFPITFSPTILRKEL